VSSAPLASQPKPPFGVNSEVQHGVAKLLDADPVTEPARIHAIVQWMKLKGGHHH
jgi:hypothetical protein